MMNLFTPVAGDKSLQYLARIFGGMNGIINSDNTINILSTMFRVFNSIILAVGALIVVYIVVVGVLTTAHQGEFVKKWDSLWTPIRTVMGIAALIPTSTGYSGIQLLMMWVIVQGIGVGDTMWSTVLGFVEFGGSMQAQVTVPAIGVKSSLNTLFQSVICEETAKATYPSMFPFPGGQYYCSAANSRKDSAFCDGGNAFDSSSNKYAMGPDGACGTLYYCDAAASCQDPDSLACKSCGAQVAYLASVISDFRGIAKNYVDYDYQYKQYVSGIPSAEDDGGTPKIPEFIADYCKRNNMSDENCKGEQLPSPQPFKGNASASAVKEVLWPAINSKKIDDFIGGPEGYAKEYQSRMTDMTSQYISGLGESSSENGLSKFAEKIEKTVKEIKMDGWLYAGGYYYAIAQVNNKAMDQSLPELTITPSDPNSKQNGPLTAYRTNFAAAAVLLQASRGSSSESSASASAPAGGGGVQRASADLGGGSDSGSPDALSSIANENEVDMSSLKSVGTEGGESTDTTFTGALQASSDMDNLFSAYRNPLAITQQLGATLLIIAFAVSIALTAAIIILSIILNLNVYILGTGVDLGMGKTFTTLVLFLSPMIYALIGCMIAYGGLFSVYMPLVPYIIFTFGAIGWFMSTIEAMVAAPLVALAILSPGGQHEVLGKAEPALMLIFSIFLRPSLMIFGLVAANLMATLSVVMIASLFSTVKSSIGISDPIGLIMLLFAYVSLVLSAVNKSFTMIHVIPDRVLTWIGGQGVPSEKGDEALQEVKGAIKEAGSGMASAGSQAGAAGSQHASSGQGKRDENRRADEKAKKAGEDGGSAKDEK